MGPRPFPARKLNLEDDVLKLAPVHGWSGRPHVPEDLPAFLGRDEDRERGLLAHRLSLLRGLRDRSQQLGQGTVEQGFQAVVVYATVRPARIVVHQPPPCGHAARC